MHFINTKPFQVSEAELVRQCKKGDLKSQQRLYDLFSDRFYRLAFRYVKDQAEAEDVVMMAFVKIFTNLHRFTWQEAGSLPFVLSTVRHLALGGHLGVAFRSSAFRLFCSLPNSRFGSSRNPPHRTP
ncbi:MAG: hypothetical protein MUE95_11710 [Cyclobacteriaceae bacterium]|nr:hypothetical protein [Cyclobacteriaceae bacterium]